MIVVINPSGSAGHSFKGLHAYCAHDQERVLTSERVDWIDMRNIAANDPAQAWKVMAATAGAQNDLKRAAGVRAGRTSKDGAVMHVVLSFDQDEPTDPEAMQTAADEFLSQLGADPAKMRGKAKPKRRQFANEHQVVMYAHSDTDNAHLHLMINSVHPEHGVKLPTSNNQLKAQKWALDFSKRHGTDKKTPARSENAEMRADGEYVKGEKRKSRNAYEQEQAAKAANDNERLKAVIEAERRKDAALALRRRNLEAMQARTWQMLTDGHRQRKAALARHHQRDMNKLKSEVREEFRPKWRELRRVQESERQTFAELERSFFGRASNMAKTALSAQDIGDGKTGVIARTFRILTNAGERQVYFDAAQQRAQSSLQCQQAETVSVQAEPLKATQEAKQGSLRAIYAQERQDLAKGHQAAQDQIKADWKKRSAQRDQVLQAAMKQAEQEKAQEQQARDQRRAERKAAPPHPDKQGDGSPTPPRQSSPRDNWYAEFLKRSRAQEQDNDRGQDQDRDDDIDI